MYICAFGLLCLISAFFHLSGVGQFFAFFDSCFPILKNEWETLESLGISTEQV